MKLEYNHCYKALDEQDKLCVVLKYTGSIVEDDGHIYHCFDTLWEYKIHILDDKIQLEAEFVTAMKLKPLNSAEEAIYG